MPTGPDSEADVPEGVPLEPVLEAVDADDGRVSVTVSVSTVTDELAAPLDGDDKDEETPEEKGEELGLRETEPLPIGPPMDVELSVYG